MDNWILAQIHNQALKELRKMPIERLKALWDEVAESEDSHAQGYDCEDIHKILNERGEGKHCAV